VKWFPAAKTGMIAGIVVSGFGLASVYVAPLTTWLMSAYGLQTATLILGILFLAVVCILAQLLKTPPAGFMPAGSSPAKAVVAGDKKVDFKPSEMLATWQFYVVWFMYACGAGAGLMIISKMAKIADKQAGISLGFILVAVLAIGNGAGRIIAGTMSDKIGRKATIFICFVMQAALFILLSLTVKGSILAKAPILAFVTTLIGASYGANLSLFPSVAKDYYGLKNFGMNYGFVFTAWGVGGFILPLLAGKLYDKYQTFDYAYYIASALLILAAITVFFVKPPHHRVEAND
jgi:OFA family oxalate/formate antiporter-like MFS transporter